MYEQYMVYETIRSKHLNEASDKINKFRMKEFRQFVNFTMKNTLDCVLSQLGLRSAEYINDPIKGSGFIDEVILQFPEIEEARCGGTTKFRGGIRLSAAEAEVAAQKALSYLDSSLKLNIVDMNYTDKVEAVAKHGNLLKLLRTLVSLAENLDKDWSNVNILEKKTGRT